MFLYNKNIKFRLEVSLMTYRNINNLLDRLSGDLRGSLTPDARDTFKKYHDVLEKQRQLEAMFLSAFALCRELG